MRYFQSLVNQMKVCSNTGSKCVIRIASLAITDSDIILPRIATNYQVRENTEKQMIMQGLLKACYQHWYKTLD